VQPIYLITLNTLLVQVGGWLTRKRGD